MTLALNLSRHKINSRRQAWQVYKNRSGLTRVKAVSNDEHRYILSIFDGDQGRYIRLQHLHSADQ